MKVTLSCIGKFHHFDLARQLNVGGDLDCIYSGYPSWKLKNEKLPADKIKSLGLLQTLSIVYGRIPFRSSLGCELLARMAAKYHEKKVANTLQKCDVFVGLSGHNMSAGIRAQELGSKWVCDRGSTHIEFQDKILIEEHQRWGIPFSGLPSWAIEAEKAEYSACDLITVPSSFAMRTFIDAGVHPSKIRRVPYGVDLSRFYPVSKPVDGQFDVIFVGGVNVRKGVPYLIEAFRKLKHPRKNLKIIGSVDPKFKSWLRGINDINIQILGSRPQSELKEYLSRSHVFVLASIEEGLALVQAQALACGCPVICTENTGGRDLFTDVIEGHVVPARNTDVLLQRMQALADDESHRRQMSEAALVRVGKIGGWRSYGDAYKKVLNDLIQGN